MKSANYIFLLCFVGLVLGHGNNGNGNGNCVPESGFTPCPRCTYETQEELDECYMNEANNFGIAQNPARPFGALIVDQFTNTISCYGVSRGAENALFHGEISAFFNCTALYPSPIGNDVARPGLLWMNQTLYTTAEPCPYCTTAAMWRGVGRIVYGTDIPTLARLGSKQIMLRARDVLKQGVLHMFRTGDVGTPFNTAVPYLKGGVLVDVTDAAFFAGFGFARPASPFYGTDEDVFLLHDGESCGCDHHHNHGNGNGNGNDDDDD
jgi:tRNA(Arg) A34 adenosine deaminase TadA